MKIFALFAVLSKKSKEILFIIKKIIVVLLVVSKMFKIAVI